MTVQNKEPGSAEVEVEFALAYADSVPDGPVSRADAAAGTLAAEVRRLRDLTESQRRTITALTAGCERYGLDGSTPVIVHLARMDEELAALRAAHQAPQAEVWLHADANGDLRETGAEGIKSGSPIYRVAPAQAVVAQAARHIDVTDGAGDERAAALEHFTEYFVRNYPGPHTIISDPRWHAPRIFRAALYAIEAAARSRPGRESAPPREALATGPKA